MKQTATRDKVRNTTKRVPTPDVLIANITPAGEQASVPRSALGPRDIQKRPEMTGTTRVDNRASSQVTGSFEH
jgi:hypothetical protein